MDWPAIIAAISALSLSGLRAGRAEQLQQAERQTVAAERQAATASHAVAVAVVALIISVIGAVAFLSNLNAAWQTARQAKGQATAARAQAATADRSLFYTTRPYAFITRMNPTYSTETQTDRPLPNPHVFKIAIGGENFGNTPAIIEKARCQITLRTSPIYNIEITPDIDKFYGEVVIKSVEMKPYDLAVFASDSLSDEQWQAVLTRRYFIVLMCNLFYRDVFGTGYVGGLSAWWEPVSHSMVSQRVVSDIVAPKEVSSTTVVP